MPPLSRRCRKKLIERVSLELLAASAESWVFSQSHPGYGQTIKWQAVGSEVPSVTVAVVAPAPFSSRLPAGIAAQASPAGMAREGCRSRDAIDHDRPVDPPAEPLVGPTLHQRSPCPADMLGNALAALHGETLEHIRAGRPEVGHQRNEVNGAPAGNTVAGIRGTRPSYWPDADWHLGATGAGSPSCLTLSASRSGKHGRCHPA